MGELDISYLLTPKNPSSRDIVYCIHDICMPYRPVKLIIPFRVSSEIHARDNLSDPFPRLADVGCSLSSAA